MLRKRTMELQSKKLVLVFFFFTVLVSCVRAWTCEIRSRVVCDASGDSSIGPEDHILEDSFRPPTLQEKGKQRETHKDMTTRGTRSEKVKRIFQQFDANRDGGLNREEMAALVVAVNPRVKFSNEQINAILDQVVRTYGEFIDGEKGFTYDGLLRTYDDGAGNVDHDFDALGLVLDDNKGRSIASEASSSSIADERAMESQKRETTVAQAVSPKDQ